MVAIPALGGLVIGLMARFGSEKIRGHGIPEAIEAILIGGSRMQPKVAILKPLSSAISIGTGGPFGAEGPIIMTGGAFGSLFAQCFSLSAAERKTLLVAGAAAGMTAIFGTPVAAVAARGRIAAVRMEAAQPHPGDRRLRRRLGRLRPLLIGSGALFPFAGHLDLPWWGLFACVGVGIVAGLQSGLLTGLLYKAGRSVRPLADALDVVAGDRRPCGRARRFDRAARARRRLRHHRRSSRRSYRLVGGRARSCVVKSVDLDHRARLGHLRRRAGAAAHLRRLRSAGSKASCCPAITGLWALIGMAAMMGGTMRSPLDRHAVRGRTDRRFRAARRRCWSRPARPMP